MKKSYILITYETIYNNEDCNKVIDINILRKILNNNGWKEYLYKDIFDINTQEIINKDLYNKIKKEGIGLFYLSGLYEIKRNNEIYNIECFINNKVNRTLHKKILNKDVIYKQYKNIIKEDVELFLPKTYENIFEINKEELEFDKNKIYIIKPSGSWKGYGIKIITNIKDLEEYKNNIKIIRKHINNLKNIRIKNKDNNKIENNLLQYINKNKDLKKCYNYFNNIPLIDFDKVFNRNIIIQEYINNPLLFKNKKFHLRSYLMIKLFDNKLSFSYFKKAKILTAKDEYKNNDYLNHNIHDTHIGSTDADYYFPEDLQKYSNKEINDKILEYLYKQMNIIGKITVLIDIKNKLKNYDKVKNAFDVLGVDLMITEDFQIKILEYNVINIGHGVINKNAENVKEFENDFFNCVYNEGIKPFENYLN